MKSRQVKRRVYYAIFSWLIGLFFSTCQQKKETSTTSTPDEKPPVATLSKTTCIPGDTLSIQLSQPLTQLSITLNGLPIPIVQQVGNNHFIVPTSEKTGLHPLIVRGVTATKTTIADTLGIEVWSDITPLAIPYAILKTYPHQTSSFTQGLEFYRGALYESTGLNGQSRLMQIDLPTGAILKSVPLPSQYFGEGITILNDRIYQLTWTSGVCFRYTMDFTLEKTFIYHTQGWGLTHKDSTLILSDGSNKLYFLTPDFQRKGEVAVYDNTGPVMNLNELEYVNGSVFANVWQTNRIVQIDLTSGKVVGDLTMDSILPGGIDTTTNVLNGIAYQTQENAFYMTGKNWPALFKIQLRNKEKRLVTHR